MAQRKNPDVPLQELKHEAVPGYLKAFVIAFAAMGVYLAAILISSPGSAKHDAGQAVSGEGAKAQMSR